MSKSARGDNEMPFLDHLEELRVRLFWVAGALLTGFGVGVALHRYLDLVTFLKWPACPYLPDGCVLQVFGPSDGISIPLTLAMWVGVVLASPVILYHAWAFVSPALYPAERRVGRRVLAGGLLLFCLGVAIAYVFVLPATLKVAQAFGGPSLIPNYAAREYFGLVVSLALTFGIAFELPILLMALTALGLVTPAQLRRYWRHALVACFLAAAVITPSDSATTALMLAGPLYALYELGIVLSRRVHRWREGNGELAGWVLFVIGGRAAARRRAGFAGAASVLVLVATISLATTTLGAQHTPTERRSATIVLTIGAAGSGDSTFMRVDDVKLGRDGHIYVLDAGAGAVKVFGPGGHFVRRFGARGDRTGEFTGVTELTVTDSVVRLLDRIQRKEITYAVTGQHLGTRLVPNTQWLTRTIPMRGGVSIVERSPTIGQGAASGALEPDALDRLVGISRSRNDFEMLFAIRADTVLFRAGGAAPTTRMGVGTPRVQSVNRYVPLTSRFGAGGAWARLGDSTIAHADGYSGSVTWDEIGPWGARVVRRANLGRTGVRVTPDDLAAESSRFSVAHSALVPDNPSIDSGRLTHAPHSWSVASKAMFADDGTLWVGINRVYYIGVGDGMAVQIGEANTWTVFPPRNETAFTLDLRPLFRLTDVRGDVLYGSLFAPDTPPVVVVYKLDPR